MLFNFIPLSLTLPRAQEMMTYYNLGRHNLDILCNIFTSKMTISVTPVYFFAKTERRYKSNFLYRKSVFQLFLKFHEVAPMTILRRR